MKYRVAKSKIHGDGVFATQPIKKGEYISDTPDYIDNVNQTIASSFHNHDEKNANVLNTEKGNQRFLIAKRGIEVGEELTADYNLTPSPPFEDPNDFKDLDERELSLSDEEAQAMIDGGFVLEEMEEGGPHDPPNYYNTLGKNLTVEKSDPNYKYKDYAKKYNVDIDNLSLEDIESLMTNQQQIQDYWKNQTEYNRTTHPTYWDRRATEEGGNPAKFNEYVKKLSKYHTIPGDIKSLGSSGWEDIVYEGDLDKRRDDYPIDLQNFILDNASNNVSYVPQLDTTHGRIDTKQNYDEFPLVRLDDRFPNIQGKSYYQNNPTIKPEDGKLCKYCPDVSIPQYDVKMLERLWQQKTLDDFSYEEVWGDEGPPQETVYAGKTKKLRGPGTYPWSGRNKSGRKKKQKRCNPKDPKCNQYKQRADNRLKHGGPHDPLPKEYLKSQGFADATNQDLDSLLRGFNTDGYDSHWYKGKAEGYGVTANQLRGFASENHPKSFVNAAAYAQAMNKLSNEAGGRNVSNIPFAQNAMVMRTSADDLPVKEEYVAPQTLQEQGYINETGTNAVNQDKSYSTGLAKRYGRGMYDHLVEKQHGGPVVKQRRGVRENSDGSVSSHLMRAEYIPEKGWVAFPSLFQDDDGTWVDMSEEENWEKILDEANKRGEVYEFGDDKFGALAFGMGSWKPENQKYNLKRALELGYEPDETGHLPSVDEETGMFLKSMDHPTAFKEYMYGQLNNDIGSNTRVVVNPEGHFGDKQLQYVELTDEEADKYRTGGYVLEEMHEGGEPGHTHDPLMTYDPNDPKNFDSRYNNEFKLDQGIDNTANNYYQVPTLNLNGTDPDAEYNQWLANKHVNKRASSKSLLTHMAEGIMGIPELLTETIPNYIAETAEDAYDQFSKTSIVPSNINEGLDDLYHLPANLLAEDYSSYSTRDKAFAQARADGETSFMYKGKRFNTRREDDDIKLTFETDDPEEQYVFQHLTDETKKEYPILWNLMNKASGIDEISFDGVGSRWISKYDEKSMQDKNRGYFDEGMGLGDGASIHVGENPFESDTYQRFINVLIAELAHRTGHGASNNPVHDITDNFKTVYESIKYGDEKRYQTPGTDEFNTHRLTEPGIHMTVRGQMTPAIVKKVQNFLGVEEDGIFGEDTYLEMVDRFKNNEKIKASLEEYAKEYKSDDQHPELPLGFGESALWADYLNVLSAHVPELSKSTGSWKPYTKTVQNMDYDFIIPFTKESFKDRKITDFNIRELQSFLAQQGYELPNSVVYVNERYGTLYDGIVGDETKTAFKNYRKKLGYKKQGGFIEAELTPKEVARYVNGGYVLEEMHEGGEPGHTHKNPAQWWRDVPGTPSKRTKEQIKLDKDLEESVVVNRAYINYLDGDLSKKEYEDIKFGYTPHGQDRKSAYTKGVSEKLLRNITPQGYGDLKKNLDRYKRYQNDLGRNKDDLLWYSAAQSKTGKPIHYKIPKREDMFSLYLGLSQKNNSFSPQSEYKPTNAKDPNALYWKPNYWTEEGKKELVEDYLTGYLMGDNSNLANERTTVFEPILDTLSVPWENPKTAEWVLDNPLGDFTVSQGKDDKGHYISIYDIIDFDPLKGSGKGASVNKNAASLLNYLTNKGHNVNENTEASSVLGAGKPYEIYDRIYYNPDDYKKQGGPHNEGYIEAELSDEEVARYKAGGYVLEEMHEPELPKANGGGTSKFLTNKVAPVVIEPAIKLIETFFPGIGRSAGAKISRLTQGDARYNFKDVVEDVFKKGNSDNYFGQDGVILPEWGMPSPNFPDALAESKAINEYYGEDKRDLIRQYFFGDSNNMTEAVWKSYLEGDNPLGDMIKRHGPLKAFEMFSQIGAGKPLNAYELAEQIRHGYSSPLYNSKTFMDATGWKPNSGHTPIDEPNVFLDNKQGLIDIYEDQFKKFGTDVLPFDVGPATTNSKGESVKMPPRSLSYNPIRPYDDIAGHMTYLQRHGQGDYSLTSRDAWHFSPKSYNSKWYDQEGYLENLPARLMDKFGKPFVLTQTNPISFDFDLFKSPTKSKLKLKKGGLVRFNKGGGIDSKLKVTNTFDKEKVDELRLRHKQFEDENPDVQKISFEQWLNYQLMDQRTQNNPDAKRKFTDYMVINEDGTASVYDGEEIKNRIYQHGRKNQQLIAAGLPEGAHSFLQEHIKKAKSNGEIRYMNHIKKGLSQGMTMAEIKKDMVSKGERGYSLISEAGWNEKYEGKSADFINTEYDKVQNSIKKFNEKFNVMQAKVGSKIDPNLMDIKQLQMDSRSAYDYVKPESKPEVKYQRIAGTSHSVPILDPSTIKIPVLPDPNAVSMGEALFNQNFNPAGLPSTSFNWSNLTEKEKQDWNTKAVFEDANNKAAAYKKTAKEYVGNVANQMYNQNIQSDFDNNQLDPNGRYIGEGNPPIVYFTDTEIDPLDYVPWTEEEIANNELNNKTQLINSYYDRNFNEDFKSEVTQKFNPLNYVTVGKDEFGREILKKADYNSNSTVGVQRRAQDAGYGYNPTMQHSGRTGWVDPVKWIMGPAGGGLGIAKNLVGSTLKGIGKVLQKNPINWASRNLIGKELPGWLNYATTPLNLITADFTYNSFKPDGFVPNLAEGIQDVYQGKPGGREKIVDNSWGLFNLIPAYRGIRGANNLIKNIKGTNSLMPAAKNSRFGNYGFGYTSPSGNTNILRANPDYTVGDKIKNFKPSFDINMPGIGRFQGAKYTEPTATGYSRATKDPFGFSKNFSLNTSGTPSTSTSGSGLSLGLTSEGKLPFNSFAVNEPFMKKDALGNINISKGKGRVMSYDQSNELYKKLGQKYPSLNIENPSVYFHGTTSGTLPGFMQQKGLMNQGDLLKQGVVPAAGENFTGARGMNQSMLSTAFGTDIPSATRYSLMNNKDNSQSNFENWWTEGRQKYLADKGESSLMPEVEYYDKLYSDRITQFENANDVEKTFLSENFPMMFGINPKSGDASRFVIPRSDISGEVGIKGKLDFQDIPQIFVPRSKMQLTKDYLGNDFQVAPIDPFFQNLGWGNKWQQDRWKELGYKKGGFIDKELTEEEVKMYRESGYVLEELN